jgi:hypothetical protein
MGVVFEKEGRRKEAYRRRLSGSIGWLVFKRILEAIKFNRN